MLVTSITSGFLLECVEDPQLLCKVLIPTRAQRALTSVQTIFDFSHPPPCKLF